MTVRDTRPSNPKMIPMAMAPPIDRPDDVATGGAEEEGVEGGAVVVAGQVVEFSCREWGRSKYYIQMADICYNNIYRNYHTSHWHAQPNTIHITHPANVFKGRTDDDNVKPHCWDNYLTRRKRAAFQIAWYSTQEQYYHFISQYCVPEIEKCLQRIHIGMKDTVAQYPIWLMLLDGMNEWVVHNILICNNLCTYRIASL